MLHIAWSSTARTSHHSTSTTQPTALRVQLLLAAWERAESQQLYMASLDLATAQALTSFILARVPRGIPTKNARRKERP